MHYVFFRLQGGGAGAECSVTVVEDHQEVEQPLAGVQGQCNHNSSNSPIILFEYIENIPYLNPVPLLNKPTYAYYPQPLMQQFSLQNLCPFPAHLSHP